MTKETTPEAAALYVSIDAIKPNPQNPRLNQQSVDAVANSIQRFGFASPIVANETDNMIIAGHTRYLAAKKLNLETVPVRFVRLNPTEAQLLAIADNKLGELAEWNNELLTVLLENVNPIDLEDIGFSRGELDSFLDEQTVNYDLEQNKEVDLNEFEEFEHTCSRCGFQWND